MEQAITTTTGGAIAAPRAAVVTFDLMTLSGAVGDAYTEEMDGLGDMSPDLLKIPSGGSIVYEVPTDDPENPALVKTLDVVIVHHHATNAYWEGEYTGENAQPLCSSSDGHVGVDANGCVHSCEVCPRNQFGVNGEGKECKNMHRMYMLRAGDPIPLQISLPPSALRAFRDYITRSVVRKGLVTRHCVTRLGLKKETSKVGKDGKGGIVYSSPTFQLVGMLPNEQCAAIDALAEQIKEQQAVASAERASAAFDANEPMPTSEATPFDAPAAAKEPQQTEQPTFVEV